LRKDRIKRRLSFVAVPKAEIFPRIMVHEYKLAKSSTTRTARATPPMLLIISTMALGPEPPVEAGVGSACKNTKRAAVNEAFTSLFTVSDAVSPTKLQMWCAPTSSGCLEIKSVCREPTSYPSNLRVPQVPILGPGNPRTPNLRVPPVSILRPGIHRTSIESQNPQPQESRHDYAMLRSD
jgi:hypothetical protein